jgi:hypothetical protein
VASGLELLLPPSGADLGGGWVLLDLLHGHLSEFTPHHLPRHCRFLLMDSWCTSATCDFLIVVTFSLN